MQKLPDVPLAARVLMAGVLVALLGLSPVAQQVRENYRLERLALDAGDPKAASASLVRLAELEPWRWDLWLVAGHYALWGGEADTAVQYLTRPEVQEQLKANDWLALGDAYRDLGEMDQALKWWEKALQAGGADLAAHSRFLTYYQQQEDYASATVHLKAMVALQPGVAEQNYLLGLYLSISDPEAALVYLNRTAELDPVLAIPAREIRESLQTALLAGEAAYTLLQVGRALASQDQWELAVKAFQQATQARPDYAEAWAFLGEGRQHLEPADTQAALSDLQQALHLDPASVAVNSFLGLYWQRQKDPEQAKGYLQEAAKLDPKNPGWQAALGQVHSDLGDLQSAQEHFRQAIDLDPKNPVYWRLLAQFLIQHQIQLRENALPAARQAVMLAPEDAASLDVMGQVYLALGGEGNAMRFLYRALRADPQYAPTYLHLGILYLYQGDMEHARQLILQAKGLAPDTPAAEQARRLLAYYFP